MAFFNNIKYPSLSHKHTIKRTHAQTHTQTHARINTQSRNKIYLDVWPILVRKNSIDYNIVQRVTAKNPYISQYFCQIILQGPVNLTN